ncbi:MAG TPA: UvrD-helicase domain-containing protein [Planctomycetota bacterium]|nr:UvrD-helicase domain-containing protein [Planctomycetota bacterium]
MDWMDVRTLAEGQPQAASQSEPWLAGLNAPQRQACEHVQGPLLILAGPGSGKTRVITTRIAHLVTDCGTRPEEILALTFTNKAAKEMRERVARLLGDVSGMWVSTFHAMCARILRRDIEVLPGYTRNFTIYDTADKRQLIKNVVKELGFDAKRFRPPALASWISADKNRNPDRDGWTIDPEGGIDDEVLARVGARYQERMRENNALDFDDLLLLTLELFELHPGVRDAYAYRFRQVMVDEYQDTNRVQYRLVRHLASHYGNLAVCGDPDQSIYGWRGADVSNILDFEQDYPNAQVVRLEQNYRATGAILEGASGLIDHNAQRKAKALWSEGERGEAIQLIQCGDEEDEARELALRCKGLHRQGIAWSDIAVFYRMNFMQRAIESSLRLSGVPYQVVGGLEFYARREIKDLMAWLCLLVNPRDDGAFLRVVNVPSRGVGEKSLAGLVEWARARGMPLVQAAASEEARATLRGRAKKGLAEFSALLEALDPYRDGGAGEALDAVLETIDAERWFAELDDGDGLVDRESNVEELRSHAHEYDRLHPKGRVPGFLQDVALISDVDGLDEGSEQVKLMTLHSSKGLEFPHVFIVGLEEELLPHGRALEEDPEHGLEEERRLLYVGMTRAQRGLCLSYATQRRFFGDDRWQRPSRFLEEIPPTAIEGGELLEKEAEEDMLGAFDAASSGHALAVGMRVRHGHFGMGTILQLVGSGPNARATVEFRGHGTKQLLLAYAGLEPQP